MRKIINKIKHIFIPHCGNDYTPHFFREASVLAIVVLSIFVLTISFGSRLYIRSTDMLAEVLPSVLVDLTNNARSSSGESNLSVNPILEKAAQMKAEDMAIHGYFAHTSPQGISPWYWFSKAGYTFVYAGENLAINFSESLDVNNAWLDPPTHKANILNDKFTEIGIATKEGYYDGRPTVYVVQMFGKPSSEELPNDAKLNKTSINIKENNSEKEEVKSVAVKSLVKGEAINLEDNLETIVNNEKFISVKNNSVSSENINEINHNQKYSKWYEKLIFLIPFYTDKIYNIFIWVILIALLIMLVVEIRHQKPKNIIYGIFIVVIMICLIYINRSMLITDLLI